MSKIFILILLVFLNQIRSSNLDIQCPLLITKQACELTGKQCQYSLESTRCSGKCEYFDQSTCESERNSSYCQSFPSYCQQKVDCSSISSSDQCLSNPDCQWNPPVEESCTNLPENSLEKFCNSLNSQQNCQNSSQCLYTKGIMSCQYNPSACGMYQCDSNFCNTATCFSPQYQKKCPLTSYKECSINCLWQNGSCIDFCSTLDQEQCQSAIKLRACDCEPFKNQNPCIGQTETNKYCTCTNQQGSCNSDPNYCSTLKASQCKSQNQFCKYTPAQQGTCTNKVQCSNQQTQNQCNSQQSCSWVSYRCQTKHQYQCQPDDSHQSCTNHNKFCNFISNYK
ncbi:hypothetical protein ABPG74_021899 [Tetrahymena malaccensis]